MNLNQSTQAVHIGLCVSGEDNARRFFEELFGLERIKEFEVGPELISNLFGQERPMRILVYRAGPVDIEVFLAPPAAAPGFAHVCLSVSDRDGLLYRAREMGLGTNTHTKPDGGEIVFLSDFDGNLYEIKENA